MTSRFSSLWALFRASIQANLLYCSLPGNKLASHCLRLCRQNGLISGFSLDFRRKKHFQGIWHGYPRYLVYPKYRQFHGPFLKELTLYPKTGSHFRILRLHYHNFFRFLEPGEFLILSTPKGIQMFSISSFHKLPLAGKPLIRIKI